MDRDLFVSWGELLWDLYPDTARLGGAPSNLAVHLAALGFESALVSRVGSDELGHQAIEALASRGVDTAALQKDPELPTGRVGIAIERGEARYTLHPGAWERIACDDAAVSHLTSCRALCFGSLSQESKAGRASFWDALKICSPNTLRLCDPNLRGGRIDVELTEALLRAATVVKINDNERDVLAQTYGQNDPIRWLINDLGVELVAETLGAKGSVLHTSGARVEEAGIPATVGGDNVGAGDSYGAVLAAGLVYKAKLHHVARAANLYASFVASQPGATPIPPLSLVNRVRHTLGLGAIPSAKELA